MADPTPPDKEGPTIPGGEPANSSTFGATGQTGSTVTPMDPAAHQWWMRMIDDAKRELRGDLAAVQQEINHKLEHIPSTHMLVYTVGGGLVAGLLGVLALLQYGSDRFDGGGALVSGTIQHALDAKKEAADVRKLSEENAKQIQELVKHMQDTTRETKVLIDALKPQPPQTQGKQ